MKNQGNLYFTSEPQDEKVLVVDDENGPRQALRMLLKDDYDVLLATTIIESGLDIPNANTIIINDARNASQSDLNDENIRLILENYLCLIAWMNFPKKIL